jgi:hypothetical protein
MLTGRIATAVNEAVAQLAAKADQPVELPAAAQTLALEIAGQSMHSVGKLERIAHAAASLDPSPDGAAASR